MVRADHIVLCDLCLQTNCIRNVKCHIKSIQYNASESFCYKIIAANPPLTVKSPNLIKGPLTAKVPRITLAHRMALELILDSSFSLISK